jgi:hypothetical protein
MVSFRLVRRIFVWGGGGVADGLETVPGGAVGSPRAKSLAWSRGPACGGVRGGAPRNFLKFTARKVLQNSILGRFSPLFSKKSMEAYIFACFAYLSAVLGALNIFWTFEKFFEFTARKVLQANAIWSSQNFRFLIGFRQLYSKKSMEESSIFACFVILSVVLDAVKFSRVPGKFFEI